MIMNKKLFDENVSTTFFIVSMATVSEAKCKNFGFRFEDWQKSMG